MCFRKEWFFNFTELDGGVFYLADNQPCKIAGISSISLKNRDGSTRVLTDVRYIPKLERISFLWEPWSQKVSLSFYKMGF